MQHLTPFQILKVLKHQAQQANQVQALLRVRFVAVQWQVQLRLLLQQVQVQVLLQRQVNRQLQTVLKLSHKSVALPLLQQRHYQLLPIMRRNPLQLC